MQNLPMKPVFQIGWDNQKCFKQYRFYFSSDNPFVPTVVFYDTKCTFCLDGSVNLELALAKLPVLG